MVGYLLDTHALLWYSQRDAQLPASVLDLIQQPTTVTHISRVSLLEITIKVGIGKLQLPVPLAAWLDKTAAVGFGTLEIEDKHLVALAALPLFSNHRDPFDRLLIAQALTNDLTLISRDSKFAAYPDLKLRWE